MRAITILLMVYSILGFARAVDPVDMVSTQISSRNKSLKVTISGYPSGPAKKVTGTNTSFSVHVAFEDNPSWVPTGGMLPWGGTEVTVIEL